MLELQKNHVKGLFRRAKALKYQNSFEEAQTCLELALKEDPENTSIQKELENLKYLKQKREKKQRNSYSKSSSNPYLIITNEN